MQGKINLAYKCSGDRDFTERKYEVVVLMWRARIQSLYLQRWQSLTNADVAKAIYYATQSAIKTAIVLRNNHYVYFVC